MSKKAVVDFIPSQSSLDAATTAWVNAVVSAGGAVSTTQKGYVDTLIKGLKTDSIFTLMDGIFLFGGESDAHQATIDITNLRAATAHGTITLSAGGYTSNGTDGYLSTTFNPTTAGGNFTQNSAHLGFYTASAMTAGNCSVGAYDGTVYAEAIMGADGSTFFINNSSSLTLFGDTTAGFALGSRTSSILATDYKGNTAGGMNSVATSSNATVANINVPLFMFARNNQTTADAFSTLKHSAITFGGGLNSTQAGNLFTRLNNYLTSWGINA